MPVFATVSIKNKKEFSKYCKLLLFFIVYLIIISVFVYIPNWPYRRLRTAHTRRLAEEPEFFILVHELKYSILVSQYIYPAICQSVCMKAEHLEIAQL